MFIYPFIYLFIFLLSSCTTLNQEARTTVTTTTTAISKVPDIVVPELITEIKALPTKPQKIALLLPPPKNRFGILGNAIKNGFIAAADANQSKIQISTHYVNSNNVSSIYKKVVKQGANFVVGPLLKITIESLVKNKVQLPVPVLALNHLDSPLKIGNLYQFALSAKDEAKAVAQLAKQHHRAIALYPNTDWGKGVFNAFSKEWQTGQIVKEIPYFYYNNYVTSISRSLAKNKNIDMIFLVAHPNKAYKIVPTLKRKFKNVAIYSTSHIYRGKLTPKKDYKLNNIIFIDMPWILTKDLPFQIKRHKRLYAFGMDAYLLVSKFQQREWQGKTGHLFVDNLGVIHRNQFIALKFVKGKPQLLNK